ncbi:hypothetical protein WJX84_012469 [Apatococcus fuscideae]|uniref:Uncharacterized protein n=1 Tax=Apatococcus fuscideae TaxID=2026836 RepID=A0AAW1SP66_9CHLO
MHVVAQSLDLGSNHLTGSLEGVEELDHLHSLRLDSNNFTGAVPRVSSPFLEVLDLSFNDLSGPLPASLADLVSLSMLMLAGNHFLEGQLTNQFTALSLLSILDISGSGLQHDMNHPNDAGDYLPDWLQLNRTGPLVPTQILQLMCYSVRAADNYIPYLTRIFISPSYFHYQACILHCHPYGTNLYYLIFASAILLILLPLIIVLAWPQLRARWVTLKDRWWSKSGAPAAGQMMSLVGTDVQGSTELWEWNNFVADNAMLVHDET